MKNTDIIATGGFNTGRKYTADGQRIFWAQRADGWVYFNDADRMISGWVDGRYAGENVSPRWLMSRYDAREYNYFAPTLRNGERAPNPKVPANFDYGADLRI
jgi:hypothetical protein